MTGRPGRSGVYPRRPEGPPERALEDVAKRLWPRVVKTETCWICTGSLDSHGYGRVCGRKASHVAWELASGEPIPDGMDVLHICDTPACVRNDEPGTYTIGGIVLPRFGHLALGTQLANIHDLWAKGRGHTAVAFPEPDPEWVPAVLPYRQPCGRKSPAQLLTDDQLRDIRHRWHAGLASQSTLSAEFALTREAIRRILRGDFARWAPKRRRREGAKRKPEYP